MLLFKQLRQIYTFETVHAIFFISKTVGLPIYLIQSTSNKHIVHLRKNWALENVKESVLISIHQIFFLQKQRLYQAGSLTWLDLEILALHR